MKYISMTAMFDDMDTAELAARSLTRSFPSIKSVKLHYKRQEVFSTESYSANALTAANPNTYVNVGYGVVPPQGAAPMFAVYQAVGRPGGSYFDRKVKLSVIAPADKRQAITSSLINHGGHFVRTKA